MRKVKCPTCSKMNPKSEAVKIGNRYYCIECGEKREREIERNKDGWDELYEYICELHDIKKPTGMMFKQIAEYRGDPYNYTNQGMLATLKYYHEILGNEVLEGSGLGIVPYYYDETRRYYGEIYRVRDYMEEFEPEEETQVITIKQSKLNENKKIIKELPFDNILEEETDE